ncbi:MAG: galactose oxidase [Armatimonadetes bacterium]|nr:galactose oxidase [Armatimonadota bacterium]
MGEPKHGPDWVCVNQRADWPARDSQGEFVFDNHLWILGGWFTPQTPNPRDVWKSPDGLRWTRTVETAPWEHSDLSAAMPFRGRMWFMGGRKLPGAENSNKVWSSADGAEWTLETDRPGWCPRVSPSFAVFRERMWVMGGTENFYDDNDQTLKDDVWSTADGRDWRLEAEHAGWPKRTHAQAVVFDGKLWITGGGRWQPETVPLNDVWCTEDGVNWVQVTPAAAWDPRIWFSLVVYRGRMWVLGGWSRTHGNFGDVWYSRDGRDWIELKSDVIWTRRHEHATLVFKDRIWVAGGYAEALNSEVWTLHIPDDWFDDE